MGLWVWGGAVPDGWVLAVSDAGPSVGRSGVPWHGQGSRSACVAAAWLAAGWRLCVEVPGGVWGCGAGLPVGPGAGSMCGCASPGGFSGRVPTAPLVVGLGTALLPAGDARCPCILVAAWCCGWCCCAARLDARSCRGLCGAPALDGAGAFVVRMASAACCRCGEVTGAWGAENDGPEDVEAVGPCGAPTIDGARARTFVALVAAVARARGGRVVMVTALREGEEELWFRKPPAIILATAALHFRRFGEHPSTQTSRWKLILLTKTKHKWLLRKSHVVWLNARHQGTSVQGSQRQLVTHTILSAVLTFRTALVPQPLDGSCGTVFFSICTALVISDLTLLASQQNLGES